jgi:hypothetical protein
MRAIQTAASAVAFAAIALAGGAAHASTTQYYSGSSCTLPSRLTNLSFANDGAANILPLGYGAISTSCPAMNLIGSNFGSFDQATATVGDYTSSDTVSCYFYQKNWDGTDYMSETKYSCSTWGGCTSASQPSYTGIATLLVPHNDFAPSNMYPITQGWSCSLPGQSWVHGYNVTID